MRRGRVEIGQLPPEPVSCTICNGPRPRRGDSLNSSELRARIGSIGGEPEDRSRTTVSRVHT